MDDKIEVVQQYPFRLVITLHAGRLASYLGKAFLDLIGNRLYLAGIGSRTQDKVIGERS